MMEKQKLTGAVLFLTAFLGIALPSFALYGPDGIAAAVIRTPAVFSEIGQLLVLAAAYTLAAVRFREKRKFLLAVGAISLIWLYLHVVLLPVLLSGLYFADMILIGRLIRRRVRNGSEDAGFRPEQTGVDLVFGISAIITLFCILSAANVAYLPVLRGAAVALGVFAVFFQRKDFAAMFGKGDSGPEKRKMKHRLRREYLPRPEFLFCLWILMLQAARINIALDYDTLWYGMRSQYVLLVNGSIYQNPGLVGMVYVYSKGFETLMLPLSGLASHSYHLCISLWFLAAGLQETVRIAKKLAGVRMAVAAALFTAATPAITNMSLAGKPDIITWYVQLLMIGFFFRYLSSGYETKREGLSPERKYLRPRRKRMDAFWLLMTGAAFLLSLSLKPSALVFSTAMMGMMGVFLILTGKMDLRAKKREWAALLLPAATLIGIWMRTWLITGMPVTSVFTSIFAKLGFELKYPFKVTALPESYQSDPAWIVLLRRLFHILIYPHGKDMNHVAIAWATALPVMFLVIILFSGLFRKPHRRFPGMRTKLLHRAYHVIFWPVLLCSMISLCMLYQIDGNYYMLLCSMIIFWASVALRKLVGTGLIPQIRMAVFPMLLFAALVTVTTNWSMREGLTPVKLLNKGRENQLSEEFERMKSRGSENIWYILAEDPSARCIAFGEHPFVLQFPCVMQAYKDITKPWGNVDLVLTPESFEEYMDYAKTDYVFAEREYFSSDEEEWNLMILRGLIRSGCLDDLIFENGNCLMKRVKEHVSPEKAEANLQAFDANLVKKAPKEDENRRNERQ
ncbi:MAG: potassium transporter KefB [Clostridium sp.]|nr:potassium transporter KefB [Clostridium sp.]